MSELSPTKHLGSLALLACIAIGSPAFAGDDPAAPPIRVIQERVSATDELEHLQRELEAKIAALRAELAALEAEAASLHAHAPKAMKRGTLVPDGHSPHVIDFTEGGDDQAIEHQVIELRLGDDGELVQQILSKKPTKKAAVKGLPGLVISADGDDEVLELLHEHLAELHGSGSHGSKNVHGELHGDIDPHAIAEHVHTIIADILGDAGLHEHGLHSDGEHVIIKALDGTRGAHPAPRVEIETEGIVVIEGGGVLEEGGERRVMRFGGPGAAPALRARMMPAPPAPAGSGCSCCCCGKATAPAPAPRVLQRRFERRMPAPGALAPRAAEPRHRVRTFHLPGGGEGRIEVIIEGDGPHEGHAPQVEPFGFHLFGSDAAALALPAPAAEAMIIGGPEGRGGVHALRWIPAGTDGPQAFQVAELLESLGELGVDAGSCSAAECPALPAANECPAVPTGDAEAVKAPLKIQMKKQKQNPNYF